MIHNVHPGSGSYFYPSRNPDPGVNRIPDPDQEHWSPIVKDSKGRVPVPIIPYGKYNRVSLIVYLKQNECKKDPLSLTSDKARQGHKVTTVLTTCMKRHISQKWSKTFISYQVMIDSKHLINSFLIVTTEK
jgi:hypothetical protein